MKKIQTILIGAAASMLAIPAMAGTVTNTFQAKIVIQNTCAVNLTAPTDLDFGTQGVLSANVDTTSTITFTCTSGAPYNIGLNAGANPSSAGDVSTRRMKHGTADYVSYQMYTATGRTGAQWGDTVGTDTQAGTGTGTAQTTTVYGRVPPQATPPAGSYADTVTVTVTY